MAAPDTLELAETMTRTLEQIDADIAAIREAMGTAAKRVRYRDGREVEFTSVKDQERAISFLEGERAAVQGNPPATRVAARYVSGLSG